MSVLFVQDFSSPHRDDKHRGYTDLLHPICGSAVRARVRNVDATTGRRGTLHPSAAHVTPSMGLMGRIPASDWLRQVSDRN